MTIMVAFVLLLLSSFLNVITAQNPLRSPVSIPASDNGYTEIVLYVTPHYATVYSKEGIQIATLTIRAFEYNGETQFIGPTIHAKPGDIINVTLINNLTGVGRLDRIANLTGQPLGKGVNDSQHPNQIIVGNFDIYKDPDVVNLHTHGLHVNPNQDDVLFWTSPRCTTKVDSQYWDVLDCYDESHSDMTRSVTNRHTYIYRIPHDHYPGTHWYHAHWHGSVTFHVIQGLYGLFIIDDEISPPPMTPVELLVGYAWLHDKVDCAELTNLTTPYPIYCPFASANVKYDRPVTPSTSYPFSFPITSACFITCKMQAEGGGINVTLDSGPTYTQLDLSGIDVYPVNTIFSTGLAGKQLFFVNGQVQPLIPMVTTEWYHFRMVNTVMNYLLFWVANQTTRDHCEFKVMGQDGVYFPSTRPRNLYNLPYQNYKVVLPPGSRADLAVRCDCPLELSSSCHDGREGFCCYDIYASSKFEVDDVDQFAPLPEYDVPLLILNVTYPAMAMYDNNTVFDLFDNWEPQSYTTTPYLTDTTGDDVETDAFCSAGDFSEMTQCNIVHGRTRYPSGLCGQFFHKNGRNCGQVAMNQVQFHHEKTLSKVCVGNATHFRTHEWMVTSNFHPFHHHTWPFQPQRNITKGFMALKGDWRDTLGAAGTFRMRSNYQVDDFDNFTKSALIMHCHYVPHEDHGMMQQVEITSDCDDISGKYIIPNITEPETVIITDATSDDGIECLTRNATSWIYMDDVYGLIGIELAMYKDADDNCKFQFKFLIIPRSLTVGNLWIGIGINSETDLFDNDNHDATHPNWKGNMTGSAIVASITATEDGPLQKLTTLEVKLDKSLRTTEVYPTNCFHCDDVMVDEGSISFKCSRPFSSQCNSESADSWMGLLDGSRYFSYAYGEGQFQSNITYHATRGGCAFSLNDILYCNISQNAFEYDVKPGDVPSTTIMYTQFETSEAEDGDSTDKSYMRDVSNFVIMIILGTIIY